MLVLEIVIFNILDLLTIRCGLLIGMCKFLKFPEHGVKKGKAICIGNMLIMDLFLELDQDQLKIKINIFVLGG